jgi:tRNA-dihydrouridine synthase
LIEWFCGKVKESVNVPVVANGDIRNEEDIHRVADMTGVDGKSVLRFVSPRGNLFLKS